MENQLKELHNIGTTLFQKMDEISEGKELPSYILKHIEESQYKLNLFYRNLLTFVKDQENYG